MGETLYLALLILGLIVAGAYLLSRGRVKRFIKNRYIMIMAQRRNVEADLGEAKANNKTFRARMESIRDDIDQALEDAEVAGEHDGKKMLIDAEIMADQIIGRSMQRADHEIMKKDREFYHDLVERYVEEVEQQLKGKTSLEQQVRWGKKILRKIEAGERRSDGR